MKILLWFFPESSIRTLSKIYHFLQLVWNGFTMNDREAVQSDISFTVNIQMLHYYWYSIMIFCPFAHHLFMTLLFLICSMGWWIDVFAHLSQSLKWIFLIEICPLSVGIVIINFSHFCFFSRTTWLISFQLDTKHSWMKGIQVCPNEKPCPLPRGDNYEREKKIIERWATGFLVL